MAMQNGAAHILPLLLMSRGHGSGMDVEENMLRDLAPFLQEGMQSRMLKTASLLQAMRHLRQAEGEIPAVMPRRTDPVELLTALSRYMGEGTALPRVAQQLHRVKQMRGMLSAASAFTGLAEGLPGLHGPREPQQTAQERLEPNPPEQAELPGDLVARFQSALSHVGPETLRQVQEMAKQMGR